MPPLANIIKKLLFLGLYLHFSLHCAIGQDVISTIQQRGNVTERQSRLIFEKVLLFPLNTQLSLAIIRNGKVAYFGVERTKDSVRSVANHTRAFEIGSISKVFTSTLLAGLILQKEINPDGPVNPHLPAMNKANPLITFTQLANHTSGLPRLPPNLNLFMVDQTNPYKDYGPEKLEAYLAGEITLSDPPGSKYAYSNLGAGLLGYVLAEMQNTSYEELLQNRILIPLRMTSSTTDRQKVAGKLVKGINYEGKEVPNWDLNVLAGAGGILSTVEDLGKFAVAHFDPLNGVLALTRKPTFHVSDRMDIALGWHLINEIQGKTWVWHNGGTGGYTSSLILDIENGNGVIILSNVSAFSQHMGNIDKLAFELITSLLEEK